MRKVIVLTSLSSFIRSSQCKRFELVNKNKCGQFSQADKTSEKNF